ncbi:MAG: DegT/DnrJ/EryC1/StrS family aminotransferase [Candidatus Omnitrophica bacterium]|nr:DegT/DnrJ/EryC1/StrS family aminotransferase [Candidatus Omnitrophota bacterium]
MGIVREIPPTAGFALSFQELFASWNKSGFPGTLEQDFSTYLNASYARVVASGTAGMYYIAAAIKELSFKRTIIVPAYICPSVVLAIARAGLKVYACDVNADNFDYDKHELARACAQNKDIAAIVAMHLGGFPADLDSVLEIARKNNILVIEDCAQSLGAEYRGQKVGTIGDISFFSMARGKGLTIYEGGVVATNLSRYADLLDKKIIELEQETFWGEALTVAQLAGYAVFYRPQLLWWFYRLPEFFWHATGQRMRELSEHFTLDFPVQKVSGFRKSVGHAEFARLKQEIERQRRMAEKYRKELASTPEVSFMTEPANSRATYPYLTLILDDNKAKKLMPLKQSGWGISDLFSAAIPDYEYLKNFMTAGPCPHARFLSQRILTLSTSSFLTDEDFFKVCRLIKN